MRPCLKPASSPGPINLPSRNSPMPSVHFPPTPRLTTDTYFAYSPALYDRSPHVVTPNACALPERDCPTRRPPYPYSSSGEAMAMNGSGSGGNSGDGEHKKRKKRCSQPPGSPTQQLALEQLYQSVKDLHITHASNPPSPTAITSAHSYSGGMPDLCSSSSSDNSPQVSTPPLHYPAPPPVPTPSLRRPHLRTHSPRHSISISSLDEGCLGGF